MLSPQEISDKVFIKAVFGGYDMTGVDDFLEAVSTDYSALYQENAILKGKLKVLVEKVEEYRSTEDAMRMALLTAQRTGDEITLEANKKMEEARRTADKEIRIKLAEMTKRVADEELRLNVAAKETAKFIEFSQAVMRKHSEFLTKLEAARRTVQPDASPPLSTPQAPTPTPPQADDIADVAEMIGNAVERLTSSDAVAPSPAVDPAPNPISANTPDITPLSPFGDDSAITRQFSIDGDEETVSPRPRFDFDDLKFGANFNNKD